MTEVKGMLIGIRRYKFTDESTGEVIKGAKVSITQRPNDRQAANTKGLLVMDVNAPFDDYDRLARVGSELIAKQVVIDCETELRSRGMARLIAHEIRPADLKEKAAA